MKKLWLLLPFIFIHFNSFAQRGAWYWAVEGNVPSSKSLAEGYSIAQDKNHNVFLTGFFDDTVFVGSDTVYNKMKDISSAYIVKYDSNGNTLWAKQSEAISKSLLIISNSVITDNWGNSYITGSFYDTVSFGSFKLQTSHDNGSMFLVKYDKNGNVKWAKQTSEGSLYSNCEGYSLATDNSGNIYVTGPLDDTAAFGSINVNSSGSNFYIAKYDSSGNVLWIKRPENAVPNTNGSVGTSIFVDRYKNIYLTGTFNDSLSVDNFKLAAPSAEEIYLAKFDSSGNTTWLKQSTGQTLSSFAYPAWLTVSKTGCIYLSGEFFDTLSFDTIQLIDPQTNYFTAFLCKFDPSGNTDWAKKAKCSQAAVSGGWTVATDTFNKLYFASQFLYSNDSSKYHPDTIIFDTSAFIVYDPLFYYDNSFPDGNSLLLELDSTGNVLCGSAIAGAGDDQDVLSVDPSGQHIYFGGDLLTALKLGPDSLPFQNSEVPFMSRWQPCGSGCNLSVTTNTPPTLCTGQSDTLNASGGTTYNWSPSTGLNATTGNSVIASPTVTTTYEVVASAGSCVDSAQMVVAVIPSPNQPTFIQHNDTLVSSSLHDNQWYRNDTLLKDTSRYLVIDTLGWYWVEVNNEVNGCSTASDSVNISSLTGVKQLTVKSGELSVYPNPSSDLIYVSFSQQQTRPVQLSLYNIFGQEVYTTLAQTHTNSNSTITIRVAGLPDGVYVLRVNEGNSTQQKEIVVAR